MHVRLFCHVTSLLLSALRGGTASFLSMSPSSIIVAAGSNAACVDNTKMRPALYANFTILLPALSGVPAVSVKLGAIGNGSTAAAAAYKAALVAAGATSLSSLQLISLVQPQQAGMPTMTAQITLFGITASQASTPVAVNVLLVAFAAQLDASVSSDYISASSLTVLSITDFSSSTSVGRRRRLSAVNTPAAVVQLSVATADPGMAAFADLLNSTDGSVANHTGVQAFEDSLLAALQATGGVNATLLDVDAARRSPSSSPAPPCSGGFYACSLNHRLATGLGVGLALGVCLPLIVFVVMSSARRRKARLSSDAKHIAALQPSTAGGAPRVADQLVAVAATCELEKP